VSKLVTPEGQILVPGIKEMIAPVTDDEQKKFEAIHFNMTVSCIIFPFAIC
jgi:Cys-Gly metallodipeptidase DUG1